MAIQNLLWSGHGRVLCAFHEKRYDEIKIVFSTPEKVTGDLNCLKCILEIKWRMLKHLLYCVNFTTIPSFSEKHDPVVCKCWQINLGSEKCHINLSVKCLICFHFRLSI